VQTGDGTGDLFIVHMTTQYNRYGARLGSFGDGGAAAPLSRSQQAQRQNRAAAHGAARLQHGDGRFGGSARQAASSVARVLANTVRLRRAVGWPAFRSWWCGSMSVGRSLGPVHHSLRQPNHRSPTECCFSANLLRRSTLSPSPPPSSPRAPLTTPPCTRYQTSPARHGTAGRRWPRPRASHFRGPTTKCPSQLR
jgi:hypothetical protein